ncbi:tail fiber domain-containing protein [Morganella morganii]|nr:tail fiber domain-containing protein [Morganella morganii]
MGGHIVVAGDYDAPGVTEINPYWFAHDDTGWSQIIRGRNAGTQAIHNRSKINYSHIDGFRACEKTESAIEHTAVGCFAGASLIDSYLSTAVGYGALRGKEDPPSSGVFRGTKASETTAIGQGALQDGIEHTSSTAIGSGAGNGAYKSTNAVVIGTNAARIADALNNTVVIGTGAAYKWGSDGEHGNNVVIGANACNLVVRGNQNTIIGSIAGNQCTESTSNTWVGHQTGPESSEFSAVSNAICIGDSARTRAGNTITVGNSITNTSDGRTIIGNNATTDCQIRGIYNTTTASGSNVYVDTLGFLFRSTSSKKYKKDIEPYDLEWAYKVLEFEPIVYKPTENAANPDWTYYGYIAEQVAKVDPRYTHMEINDGVSSPSGVMYERIVVAQGMIIKDLLDRVDALESNKK